LVGPFVDAQHPIINSPEFSNSYETVFIENITRLLLEKMPEFPQTHLIIIPSLRDIQHDFVFPQPPITHTDFFETLDEEGINTDAMRNYENRVHLFPNPCTFRINDVSFGLTSLDVLYHLLGSETSKVSTNNISDPTHLFEHILKQKSYYPIFPSIPGTQIDLTRHSQFELPYIPDFLIIPSDTKQFIKSIYNTICINPGRLTKDNTGGTYAKIRINPVLSYSDVNMDTGGIDIEQSIAARSKVEIVNI